MVGVDIIVVGTIVGIISGLFASVASIVGLYRYIEKRRKNSPPRDDVNWPYARDFRMDSVGEDREFSVDLKKGQRLTGYVRSSGTVSAFVLTRGSYRSHTRGTTFQALWNAHKIEYANVDFAAPRDDEYHFVVSTATSLAEEAEDDDEDEDYEDDVAEVTVKVRLRIQ